MGTRLPQIHTAHIFFTKGPNKFNENLTVPLFEDIQRINSCELMFCISTNYLQFYCEESQFSNQDSRLDPAIEKKAFFYCAILKLN